MKTVCAFATGRKHVYAVHPGCSTLRLLAPTTGQQAAQGPAAGLKPFTIEFIISTRKDCIARWHEQIDDASGAPAILTSSTPMVTPVAVSTLPLRYEDCQYIIRVLSCYARDMEDSSCAAFPYRQPLKACMGFVRYCPAYGLWPDVRCVHVARYNCLYPSPSDNPLVHLVKTGQCCCPARSVVSPVIFRALVDWDPKQGLRYISMRG